MCMMARKLCGMRRNNGDEIGMGKIHWNGVGIGKNSWGWGGNEDNFFTVSFCNP